MCVWTHVKAWRFTSFANCKQDYAVHALPICDVDKISFLAYITPHALSCQHNSAIRYYTSQLTVGLKDMKIVEATYISHVAPVSQPGFGHDDLGFELDHR